MLVVFVVAKTLKVTPQTFSPNSVNTLSHLKAKTLLTAVAIFFYSAVLYLATVDKVKTTTLALLEAYFQSNVFGRSEALLT